MQRAIFWIIVATTIGSAACDPDSLPTGPEPTVTLTPTISMIAQQRFQGRGIESRFVALEAAIPGFGGFYVDEVGDIIAVIAHEDQGDVAALITAAFLGTEADRALYARSDGSAPSIRVVQGRYAMSQLIEWVQVIRANATPDLGIHLYDANERLNRVRLGVREEYQVGEVRGFLERREIPTEAVVVEVTPLGSPMAVPSSPSAAREWWQCFFGGVGKNLQTNCERPVIAGFQVRGTPTNDPFSGNCTLGLAVTNEIGTPYSLWAAHCLESFPFTGQISQTVYQPYATTNRIGSYVHNPAFATSGCAAGAGYCSPADLVLIQLEDASAKKVAETSVVGTGAAVGNLTVGALFTISGTLGTVTAGQHVLKTGRTTGTTSGPVRDTCIDKLWEAHGATFEIWCMSSAKLRAERGDSGSPVYRHMYPLAGPPTYAVGIATARTSFGNVNAPDSVYTYFSAWDQIIARVPNGLWPY